MSQPEISSADANPEWTPSSWRERPVAQSVQYPDEGKLEKYVPSSFLSKHQIYSSQIFAGNRAES